MVRIFFGCFIVTVLSCSLTPINDPAPFPLSLPIVYDFEGGTLAGFHRETANDNAATVVANPVSDAVNSSSNVTKIVVSPSDLANHGNRAELSLYNVAQYGDTVFYGWRFFVPTGDPDSFQWQIMAQWYQLPNFQYGETFDFFFAHPPVVFSYVPGAVEVQANVGVETTLASRSISKGAWHLVVFEIKFRDDNQGYVQAWLDGTALTPSNGTDNKVYRPTLHNRSGCYFKVGLYRGFQGQTQATSTNTVYIDTVSVGRSYTEVD